ncbi:HTH domain-containing protein [Lactiplantibacillus daoliensis]|uniref:HTH domain-containing protein n=2 Tax=Lactiplantibacillus daoliensis TaxID=2559916 RepID=A0ABW1UCU8_9LACO
MIAMLNRQRQILTAFNQEANYLSSQQLAEKFNVSSRTITNDIRSINANFSSQLVIYDKEKRAYFIEDAARLVKVVASEEFGDDHLALAKDWPFLIYWYLYTKDEQCTIQNLEDTLHISVSLINRTLKKLKIVCRPWHVRVQGNKQGVILIGNKLWLDFALAQLTLPRINRRIDNLYLKMIFKSQVSKPQLKRLLSQLVEDYQRLTGIRLPDTESYVALVFYLLSTNSSDVENFSLQAMSVERQQFITEYLRLSPVNNVMQLHGDYQDFFEKYKNSENDTVYRLALTNFQYHEQAILNIYFPVHEITDSLKQPCPFTIYDIDRPFVKFLNEGTFTRNQGKAKVIIYTNDLVAGYQLQTQLAAVLQPHIPIVICNNMFKLDELIQPHEHIFFISDQLRIRSNELLNDISFFEIHTLADPSNLADFIKVISQTIYQAK